MNSLGADHRRNRVRYRAHLSSGGVTRPRAKICRLPSAGLSRSVSLFLCLAVPPNKSTGRVWIRWNNLAALCFLCGVHSRRFDGVVL
ncbi:hypothetical protein BaRGS_00030723 [Batillaria attramentaria]|uniref:Uncharacterized protein n=1 Tax=Batillaria attramentaria TaxID=370345 RepID=A0ABD0JT02_9CAEN